MKALLSLLEFTTILPLGKGQNFECFARHSYLYPLAGYAIGALVALPVFFIGDKILAAAVAIALLFLVTGAHHFDGLVDFGDALMAHGEREKRIRALTDRYVGAGGLAAGIVVTALLFAGLQNASAIVSAIIIGEVCAKFSMSYLTSYGIPFREGIHSYLHKYSRWYFPFISALICVPLFLLPVPPFKIFTALILMIVCPTILLTASQKMFGGVNGDVAGASNEITRACIIVAIAII